MDLGYDAFAKITDSYVELDRGIGLVQILVEQVEFALRRSERLIRNIKRLFIFFFSSFDSRRKGGFIRAESSG